MTANSTPRTIGRARRIGTVTLQVVVGAIALGALGSVAPANADAGGPYVAIAYSPDSGIHGWANNRNTYQEAVDAAMFNCRGFGGTHCQLGAWDHNQCAAVAADTGNDWGHWAGRGGADLQGAEGAAVYANGGGQIVLSRCATGDQGTGT